MTTIAMPETLRREIRPAAVLSIAAKTLLFVLLLSALIWPDMSGLKGKATTARLIVYPLGAMALPIFWVLVRRAAGKAFPWLADLLITLPWLIDLLGNRLNLFDTVSWWDDLMHFVLWGLLTAGVLVGFAPPGLSRGLTAMVALGFGTTAAVIWEAGEYVAFIRHSPELQTAYTDTLGDLVLGTLGALLAGLVVGALRTAEQVRQRAGR